MKKIKIIAIPPGFAPEEIRKQWLGIEIPALGQEDKQTALRIGDTNAGGYLVHTQDAIDALRAAGKSEAVEYWEQFNLGSQLIFKTECCEIID